MSRPSEGHHITLGILVSGSGTNLQAIIEEIEAGRLSAHIGMVISNVEGCRAVDRCRKHQIPVRVITHQSFSSRKAFEQALIDQFEEVSTDLICLAGFMRLLSPYFVQHYAGKLLNIHPSLLPAFPGLDAQRQAFTYGVKITGATVHFVDVGTDTGPIVLQEAVPVHDTDSAESLALRILHIEHQIYPKAIQLFAEGRLTLRGRKVETCINRSPASPTR